MTKAHLQRTNDAIFFGKLTNKLERSKNIRTDTEENTLMR